MEVSDLHGSLLAQAFEDVLGQAQSGSMAFARCLTPEVLASLCANRSFALEGWEVQRVADQRDTAMRTITADEAVEKRESKAGATLLLVDTDRAGAGMDGIYSAAMEVHETALFERADRLAGVEIRSRHSTSDRLYAERAIVAARGRGRTYAVSRWAAFDFLCRVAAGDRRPGAYLNLIGLWPIQDTDESDWKKDLELSRLFVDRLLGYASARLTPAQRIEILNLDELSQEKGEALQRLLHSAYTQPLSDALLAVADEEDLWIGALRVRGPDRWPHAIKLTSWRNRNGSIAKWSGLADEGEEPPSLILDPNVDRSGRSSTLSVKWKAEPTSVEKNAVEYRVAVLTGMDEEIASKIVLHRANRGGEQCRFSDDDFSSLSEDSRLPAKVAVSVVGIDDIEPQESEEFIVCYGEKPELETGSVGRPIRTFSEGLVELGDRETVAEISLKPLAKADAKGFLVLRTPVESGRRKSFRVFRPPLIKEAEEIWMARGGPICRWAVKVRGSGQQAGELEFIPIDVGDSEAWRRVSAATRRMIVRFQGVGGVGQVYDDQAGFEVPQEYLRAWAALLETADPTLALVHTIEVQTLSGRTIGLIVLPAHPLRVAWLSAYDNLVLHTAFDLGRKPSDIEKEFAGLDGAMFPAFLPNPKGGAFVFADTLGFHAVGMVPDSDKEPKAAIAILAKALSDTESSDAVPTVGKHSAKVLGNEMLKYIECHKNTRLLHVHALRAGDGFTVARSLGNVHGHYQQGSGEEDAEEELETAPIFSLDLYPSVEQRGIAGRFISEAREKRRSGTGLGEQDRWMLESLSLPGGINQPRLRWARKEAKKIGASATPQTAAHLAIAFDTFESRVVADADAPCEGHPYHAFGLMSFYDRRYSSLPSPLWRNTVPAPKAGEKHPSRRGHTETLVRLQNAIQRAVACHVGEATRQPALKTEITEEKASDLKTLHRLCDWVVTLDRNAGIEYFDSPLDNRDVYDAYVIDCVPEREDLGCLQLITSTANLDEVRGLLDTALDQMGLSRSRRNAEFLLDHLKALSGRLAIRLTGQKPATSELIALAVAHANCRITKLDDCWMSLTDGFIVPVDDVRDLLPPLRSREDGAATRPDLIYVSKGSRAGLAFQFIEVKYRRDLRSARSPDVLSRINEQVHKLRKDWGAWYGEDVCAPFRAIRRAKLARVLRFYADKAYRHFLPAARHRELVAEIHKMVAQGGSYLLGDAEGGDRGWIFCPEYVPRDPLEISPTGGNTRVFLVGPSLMPDAIGTTTAPADQLHLSPTSPDGGDRDTSSECVSGDSAKADADASADLSPMPLVSLGTDALSRTNIDWSMGVEGNPHLLIAGLPGMGKTTSLVNMCGQMVASGVRPIVFSYHEDIDAGVAQSSPSVRFIDFDGLGFNPLQIHGRDSKTAYLDVAGTMRDIFAAIFPDIGDIQGERIRKAIKDSFLELGWGERDHSAPLECPPFKRFVEILQSEPKPDRGLKSLLARLGELDDYEFFKSVQDQPSLWESDKPIVVRVHTSQNDNLQRAFASLVFYRLYKDMFLRGLQERITHAIIFDEAHRAARLKLLPTMAKECRKYGISLVVASQEAADFDTSLFSAIANYLVFRLTDMDARFLARNVANSHQEKVMIDKIKGLDKFKAMFFAEANRRPCSLALHSEEEGRIVAAIKHCMRGVSTGVAAELASVPKALLLTRLGDYGIETFDMSEEDFQRDLGSARRLL